MSDERKVTGICVDIPTIIEREKQRAFLMSIGEGITLDWRKVRSHLPVDISIDGHEGAKLYNMRKLEKGEK
jgi:hypothetical protein